jgi:protein-L-isoaspartate(D-aspartate) O-methyltransferase
MVESFRNESERVNLLYWQLTCESFYSVDEWEWLYTQFGYKGDYSFIYFE